VVWLNGIAPVWNPKVSQNFVGFKPFGVPGESSLCHWAWLGGCQQLVRWVCHRFPKRVENFQNVLLICLKAQKKYNISLPNDIRKFWKFQHGLNMYESENTNEHFKKLFDQYTLIGSLIGVAMNRHWNCAIYYYFVPPWHICNKSYIKFHNTLLTL